MRAQDTWMFAEAAEAGAVVARQLRDNRELVARAADRLRRSPPSAVQICGRGSSDNAGVYARYLIEAETGVLTSPAPLAVSSLYRQTPHLPGGVCLAISQSGRSPDLVAAASAARAGGAFVIALVNAEGSPLGDVTDLTLPLRAGEERSVAATKSFIASLTAVAQLVADWREDEALKAALEALPEQLEDAWRLDWSPAVDALKGASSLYVVGRGPGYGIAREAALKLKETCRLHAEAFSAAEVRHGPMALVRQDFPVLFLTQRDAALADNEQLAREFAERGARVIAAPAIEAGGVLSLPAIRGHATLEPILLIQSFYRLAAEVAVARGLNPDQPPYLRKVTETV